MQGLELLFHEEQKKATAVDADGGLAACSFDATDSIENIASAVKKQEESLPIDLRADSLLDQDKILNWSSPDQAQNEQELPLTGEQPL